MARTKTRSHCEIERKFLVKILPNDLADFPHEEIAQGYLALEEGGVQVRLRKKAAAYSLTYKRGDQRAREEREIALSAEQFAALWPATQGRQLTKIRYDVPFGERTIEIDVYTGRHEGVIVAEVEFPDEKSCRDFVSPEWLGEDVSGNSRYSNVVMALAPGGLLNLKKSIR
ncbi:MAG: CYTH domain-containing protein [Chthoniobacterales bacterium]